MAFSTRVRIIIPIFIVVIITVLTVALIKPGTSTPVLDHSLDPVWLKDIRAPSINNEAELDRLWQSVPRCCSDTVRQNDQIFYKSCSDAIDKHPSDSALVVKCLWLMSGLWEVSGIHRQYLKEIVVNRYRQHRDSLQNCAHCAPGDTVSRTAEELAGIYAGSNRSDDALALLESVMSQRKSDTSDWVRIETWTEYGRILLKSQITASRKQTMAGACAEFAAKQNEDTIRQRYAALNTVCQRLQITANTAASERPLVAVPDSDTGLHVSLGDVTDSRTTGKFFKYLRIEIEVSGQALETVFGSSKPVITAAVDDTGRSLVKAEKTNSPLLWTIERNNDKKTSTKTHVDLLNPARRATSFMVTGYIDIFDPAKAPGSVHTVSNFLNLVGTSRLSQQLAKPGLEIAVLTKPVADQMRKKQALDKQKLSAAKSETASRLLEEAFVKMFKDLFSGFFMMSDNDLLFIIKDPNNYLAYIEVVDANGAPIKTHGRSLSQDGENGGTYRYTVGFDKPLPKTAQLKIYYATAKSLTQIPFRFESNPLP